MIYIDFQGGAHGNYLEFVCNKFLAKVRCNKSPFDVAGASHNKIYYDEKKFQAGHYYLKSQEKKTLLNDSKIISIQICADDLLPLSSVSLLRGGNRNIDNDQLEKNTYNKCNNPIHRSMLDVLINKFFSTQIQDSYNRVKDISWPDISCVEDFKQLPKWIQLECINQHNLQLLQLNNDYPDCPRHVLREFFKISFKHPDQAGFMTQQQKMTYTSNNDVFIFPYGCFYNTNNFIQQLNKIASWSNFVIENFEELKLLHQEFLHRQIYKDSKKFCDKLLDRIFKKEIFEFPKLDLFQESYIEAHVEKHFDCELPADSVKWYENTNEIFEKLK